MKRISVFVGVIALAALLFGVVRLSESSCPKGGGKCKCQPSSEDEAAYQKYMSQARKLSADGKDEDALNAVKKALIIRSPDSSDLALLAKLAPKVQGFSASGVNKQGYIEYEHKKTGMAFVLIPGGKFMMGRRPGEGGGGPGGNDIDNPPHEVTVSDFLMSKNEVTQGAWKKITKDNPSFFKTADDYPVEQVSWKDVQSFLDKAKDIRLPTEAEWEYACRANTTTNFYWGDAEDGEYMWYNKSSTGQHKPVGGKIPNGYGLCDISGNIYEWCQDWYDAKYYYNSPKENPTGPKTGIERVLRGGSWNTGAYSCRSDVRHKLEPATRTNEIGFRCVSGVGKKNQ
ncbi:MAG: formylglycine-generating enzyme family protein [Planctomycetota bacterium]